MAASLARPIRCAIYTRKSTEHGLELEFNSLDAQRDACEACIKSQTSQGWRALPQHYDDPAYSGGNLDRPALQQLLKDIDAGRIDVIVVYKIDRLTRSLADFARLVEAFDAKSISFVAVTQQFNTTTSMGRLTLNVLLSFAQFERELSSERVRDKVAASRRKGKWTGGTVPLGYDAKDKKLVINKAEAETVRYIFKRYLELQSFGKLVEDLDARGIVTKRRDTIVEKAIEQIRASFLDCPLEFIPDGSGGAFVTLKNVPLGPPWAQADTWIKFQITFQYPYADVYPHFVRHDFTRADGKPLGPGLGQAQFQNQPAVQISRRSNKLNPATDTANLKLLKVLQWLRSQ